MTTSTSLFDVLMYLFDHCFADDVEITASQSTLKRELLMVGFGERQIDRAFDWLAVIASQNLIFEPADSHAQTGQVASHRTFNEQETDKLNTESRGFILHLEQTGILDAGSRELIIDRIMALEIEEISLQQLKWVVLMVLLNQPGREESVCWMESLVMDEMEATRH